MSSEEDFSDHSGEENVGDDVEEVALEDIISVYDKKKMEGEMVFVV